MGKRKRNLKLFYSIKEVSRLFDVKESTLRYWEEEFKELNPRKTKGGVRQYRQEDIQVVELIHFLLRKKKLTIAGARKQMENKKEPTMRRVETIERLTSVRDELKGILDAMSQAENELNQ
ncbi:MAG: MerR family transcriptional regulator [Bacteroidales bacterium]|nr:MerR family transcriptional regulator [Bacteroidales bacterium]